ncbi:hypothetical protein CBP36_18945 (plasmid) [Acidovorax carolinensis]|uniref:Uncharacterized protein n=1 Tax=Acidovorax carolinensis TaxID=553814 RepID=A0A240UHW1_9BURK|nr:hypothetical protein [Acidovorax carolinensis]ART61058.1 hypothetical protein CBP36_18945 [Acidovorax carolinensis]
MLGVYDPGALEKLRGKILASGAHPPNASFRLIDYAASWGGWRVQLPGVLGHGTFYFYFSDYGGREPALIEAQYFRDEAYAKAGVDLYMRARQRFSKVARNSILNITEAVAPATGATSSLAPG